MIDETVRKTQSSHPEYEANGPIRSMAEMYAGEYFRNAGVTIYDPGEREDLVLRLVQYAVTQFPDADGVDLFPMAEAFVSSNLVPSLSDAARGNQN